MVEMIPLFGPIPGGMEMMVILLIAVLLFGANKIPKLARSTGEAMGEFKKGRQEIETELEEMTDPDVSPSESEVSRTDASVDADASDTSEA
ncbi:Sec-independent protein translocase subunit TatA/TatB [Halorussus halobius]|uniref:Sec-independent protein translocase subunit TatA/TatB n=1 Tax=Halorussus halobius TaxID=1710537 RepID=UPI0010920210